MLFSVYNADEHSRKLFCEEILKDRKVLKINDKEQALYMDMILTSVGFNVLIDYDPKNPEIIILEVVDEPVISNVVRSIQLLSFDKDNYVYDLETESHSFHVGPGLNVVHNTDSIFFIPLLKDEDKKDKQKMLQYAIDIGVEIGDRITDDIGMYPHVLEYEKIFCPLILMDKKLYTGYKYEFDINKYKLTSMGDVAKKRGYAPIVKEIYSSVVKILLDTQDVEKAVIFFQNSLKDIFDGNIDSKKFIITKNLKPHKCYANPERVAHRVLADRVAERDPGNAFQSNQRVPFVFIEPERGVKYDKVIGADIEIPDYVDKARLRIDFKRYLEKQLKTPLSKILDLLVENSGELFNKLIDNAKQDQKKRWIKYDNKVNKQRVLKEFFPQTKPIKTKKKNKDKNVKLILKKNSHNTKTKSFTKKKTSIMDFFNVASSSDD